MKKILKNSFLIFFFFSFVSKSQDVDVDYQLWSRFELKYNVDKKTSLSLQNGIRYIDTLSFLKRNFTDVKLKFSQNKHISYSLGYRYIFNRNNDNLLNEINHRMYFGCHYKNKISDELSLLLRSRFQNESNNEKSFRQKIKISFSLKKIKIKLNSSMELFHDMFFVNEKIRYSTGFSIPINKKIFLDFNYIFESEVNKNIKDKFHIFRTKIALNLN